MTDLYTSYEAGVRELLARLGRAHSAYSTALVYQQRLTENLAAVRTYGDTRDREAARAEILHRLNTLALSALDVTFANLCPAFTPGTVADHQERPVGTQANVAGDAVDQRQSTTYVTHIERAEGVALGNGAQVIRPPGGGAVRPLTASGDSVDTATLRARLQRLDDVALDTLCLDHFPDVYDKFSRGMRRDEKINMLLDHCRRNPEDAMRLLEL